jgi:hypothetical protein
MMGAEPWSAAERARQEVLLVDSGQHLSRGVLERPVRDSWDAEFPDRAIRLRDFHPLDRLRLIISVEQLRPNVWPSHLSQHLIPHLAQPS